MESNTAENSIVDYAGEPAVEEPVTDTDTEAPENIADDAETAGTEETGSNILIAYFSRVGNASAGSIYFLRGI